MNLKESKISLRMLRLFSKSLVKRNYNRTPNIDYRLRLRFRFRYKEREISDTLDITTYLFWLG
jgi:hypothetical protein